MAAKRDDVRGGGRPSDPEPEREHFVDVPIWVLAFVVVVVGVAFGVQVARGHVDEGMYGLVALVLGGSRVIRSIQRRKLP